MPFKMDHNEFSLDHDLIEPIIEFLKHLNRREKRIKLIQQGKKISNINGKFDKKKEIEKDDISKLEEDWE